MSRFPPVGIGFLFAAALAVLGCSLASAQTQPAQGPAPGNPPAAKKQAPPAPSKSAPISAEQALYLVRSTLMSVNDANHTGNYTVLRDLAAPSVQAKFTAGDLARGFANLRERNFDLGAVALIGPQLSAVAVNADGTLHLNGFFPTRPLQIGFDLSFQLVSNRWRLSGISVTTPQAPPPPEATAPLPPEAKAPPPPKATAPDQRKAK